VKNFSAHLSSTENGRGGKKKEIRYMLHLLIMIEESRGRNHIAEYLRGAQPSLAEYTFGSRGGQPWRKAIAGALVIRGRPILERKR